MSNWDDTNLDAQIKTGRELFKALEEQIARVTALLVKSKAKLEEIELAKKRLDEARQGKPFELGKEPKS